ncbi:ATP-grasp domain-containing protein [Planosporangium sp. 12N6]|uniref:ATP-grasp domain-containing protein n=1 Tax=Planosporangium spinosum TaxID=3402278 RepID=UPI003CFB7AC1
MTERNTPPGATRTGVRVALVTCAELPELEDDDRLVIEPLAARGIDAEPAVWDDPTVDWAAFDLAVLRSPWDYVDRRERFVEWAGRVPRLANPADVVAWNTEKTYLERLAADGVPVVPTDWVRPGETWEAPGAGEYVVKPAVGAGSRDAGRYDLAYPGQRDLAAAHVARLQAAGRLVMVQPYLAAVDTDGETGLLFLGGEFSHAIRKGAMLEGPDPAGSGERPPGLYRPERIEARRPSPAQREVAEKVLAAIPGGAERLLYARVDLIPGPDGSPVLVELELTEPSLFLDRADGAAERFAEAIARRL